MMNFSETGGAAMATITIVLQTGCSTKESVYLANYTGRIVREITGIVPIELELLFKNINSEYR